MKHLKIEEIKENMILAEDIIDNNGIVILGKDSELNKRNINMLENLGYEWISIKANEVYSDNDNFDSEIKKYKVQRESDQKILKSIYDDTVDTFKNIYDSNKESGINLKKVNSFMDPILDKTLQNSGISSTFLTLNEQLGEYTYKHSINVGLYSAMLGKWLELDKKKIHELAIAGVLHDIGKCKIPSEIINKPGKLTSEEFEVIKTHPQNGYDIVKDHKDIPEAVKIAILQHHEKIDGTGYPNGLKKDEIHLYSKIISVADVYDSLTSVRSYKKAICPFKVYEILLDMSTNHLDYFLTSTFIKKISNFFIGSYVKLNSGEIAKVILLNNTLWSRPLLLNSSNQEIDLAKNFDLSIEELL